MRWTQVCLSPKPTLKITLDCLLLEVSEVFFSVEISIKPRTMEQSTDENNVPQRCPRPNVWKL